MKPKLESMGAAIRRLNPQLFAGGGSVSWAEPAFVGEAPKRRRGPAPLSPEAELHDDIIDYCLRRGWIFLHGSMATRTHRTEGEPDFTILADHARVFFVECKRADGKVSEAQRNLIHQAATLGHTVAVVRTMGEFRAFVEGPEGPRA